MRCSRRVQHAGEYIAEARRSHTKLQRVHKTKSRGAVVVFQFNGNEGAGMWGAQHSSRDSAMLRRGKTWKVNAADARMICQSLCQRARVITMTIHADGERFHSA